MKYRYAILIAASAAVSLQAAPLSAAPKGTDGTTSRPAPEVQRSQAKEPAKSGDYQALFTAYLADCMNDWDAATHMTRKQWEDTCRRVVHERAKYKLQDGKNAKP